MPSFAKFSRGVPTGTIRWSDQTPFQGFVWIGLKNMSSGNTFALRSGRTVPQVYCLPIVDGLFTDNVGVPYNAELTPPGTQYTARYYDATGRAIGSESTAFTVSSETFSIPAVTLTIPSVGSSATPDA